MQISPKTPTIGLLDSGIGGLSIVRKLLHDSTLPSALKERSYLYIADTAHLPYGNKTPEYLIERGRVLTRFFIRHNISTIIIACHTSSATSLPTLRQEFPDVTYIDLIPFTIEHALIKTKSGTIGILATQATINSGIHKKLLLKENKSASIFEQACPLFVSLIEADGSPEEIAQAIAVYMDPLLKADVDTVILGCTHYEFLRPYLEAYAPSVYFVSAAQADLLEPAQLDTLSFVSTGLFTHSPQFIQTLIGPYVYSLQTEKTLLESTLLDKAAGLVAY